VKGFGPQKLLTNIISLVRYATGKSESIEPFSDTVNKRFGEWLTKHEKSGRKFTTVQREWLTMIKDHVAASLSISFEDFELSPFYEKGGPVKVYQLFGSDLNDLLGELNEVLTAA
jgi:type I restriction enzyme, R subunit